MQKKEEKENPGKPLTDKSRCGSDVARLAILSFWSGPETIFWYSLIFGFESQ